MSEKNRDRVNAARLRAGSKGTKVLLRERNSTTRVEFGQRTDPGVIVKRSTRASIRKSKNKIDSRLSEVGQDLRKSCFYGTCLGA